MIDQQIRMLRNTVRGDGQSSSLLIGKAAEHLVCCELILSGLNAFMVDAGQPYDVLVDRGGGLFWRVSVKTTTRMYERAGAYPVYRFNLRKTAKRGKPERRSSVSEVDVFAFVALDRRLTAFLPVSELTHIAGGAKLMVEFKTRAITYTRQRSNSGLDPATAGRWMEDCSKFPAVIEKV